MKRPLLWGVAGVMLVAGGIAALKLRAPEGSRTVRASQTEAQSRLTSFWESYTRAGVLRTQGQFGAAAAAYRQALSIDPKHEDSLYYLATCHYELGEYDASEAELRRLLKQNSESGRAWGQLGRLLSSRAPGAHTDLSEARQAFEQQLRIYREQAGPLLELGQLELNEGNLGGAEVIFHTAAASGAPEAKFLYGYVLFLQKRPAEARALFRSVLDAYWADRKTAAKGVLSEGDVLPAPGKPLTALQRAALQSALFSYWVDLENGLAPKQALEALHLHEVPAPPLSLIRESSTAPGLRGIGSTTRTCMADFDGDGRTDRLEVGTAARGQSSVRLLRASGRQFPDVTDSAGLRNDAAAVDCAVADFDGDSKSDVFVLFWRRAPVLYRNLGGRFQDVTAAAGLQGIRGGSLSVAVLDYDRDGRPDLLVSYPAPLEEVARSVLEPNTTSLRAAPRLFHNGGDGTFQETSNGVGLRHAYGTIQALAADLDGDGWTDLVLLSGSPDARFLAPSVFLHNRAGQAFEEHLLAPGGSLAGNFLGGAVRCSSASCRVLLVPHPVLRGQSPGGVFRLTLPGSARRMAAGPERHSHAR